LQLFLKKRKVILYIIFFFDILKKTKNVDKEGIFKEVIMKIAAIIIAVLTIIIYFYVIISTYVFYKNNENKLMEEVRKPLLKRVRIMNVLTAILALCAIAIIASNIIG